MVVGFKNHSADLSCFRSLSLPVSLPHFSFELPQKRKKEQPSTKRVFCFLFLLPHFFFLFSHSESYLKAG